MLLQRAHRWLGTALARDTALYTLKIARTQDQRALKDSLIIAHKICVSPEPSAEAVHESRNRARRQINGIPR